MSLAIVLAAECRRRQQAESDVVRLKQQLEVISAELTALRKDNPAVDPQLKQLVGRLEMTEQELVDEWGLARQVIENSPNLVHVEDEAGHCKLANRRYTQLQTQRVTPAGTTPGLSNGVAAWPSKAAISYEESYELRNGRTAWYYTTKTPLIRTDGTRYLLTFASDVTELKQAYRLAEESVQARETFMASVSHEIRTPLHGLMGLLELLRKSPLTAQQTDYAELMQSSTESMLVVINDILDYAKLQAGHLHLEHIAFDLTRCVHDTVRPLALEAAKKNLTLRVTGLDDPLPLLDGDPHRLRQVLTNLLTNAIKFTERGSVTLAVEVAAPAPNGTRAVSFSVTDTGIGIAPENIDRVFASFEQADASIPRLYGGTGLGLSICKNLVELQGGRLGVESTLGKGSRFFFTFAYGPGTEAPVPAPASHLAPEQLHGLRVLLVEDNPINQLVASAMLAGWGVHFDTAANGLDALEKARHQPYDVLLVDVHMPQLDGIEATARLRATPGPNQQVPVVALTADAVKVNATSYRKMGFAAYLTKPYSEQALYQVLARVGCRTTAPALRYDFSGLGRLAADPVFVDKLLRLFVERVPVQTQALQAAADHADWPTVAQLAHSLKSTFGSLGIEPATGQLAQLETLARQPGNHLGATSLLAAVTAVMPRYCVLFERKLANEQVLAPAG